MTDLNAIDVGRLLQIEAKVNELLDIEDKRAAIDNANIPVTERESEIDNLWEESFKIRYELKVLLGRA